MASQVVRIRNIKRALGLDPTKIANNALDCIISGRVKSFRVMKSLNFIDLIDGSTNDHLQVICKRGLLKKPDVGSYITCQGKLIESHWPQQNVEFKVDKVLAASKCNPEKYPLFVNDSETKDGWYRRNLHLRPQAQHFASLLRIRSELELSLHIILKQMDFFKVHTPILTSNDSEVSSNLFSVSCRFNSNHDADKHEKHISDIEDADQLDNDGCVSNDTFTGQHIGSSCFFNKDVFLTTSAQLHLESLAASLSRVYTVNSAFRAENSQGPRHLCEFTMFEAEEANVDKVDQLMDRVEAIVKFAAQYLSEVSDHKSDFSQLLDRYSHHENFEKLARSNYIRMSYSEAIAILQDKLRKNNSMVEQINFGKDINIRHERILLEHCDNVPIFITDYPQRLKPFYMKLSNSEFATDPQKTVACFDLIAPLGGEICGGSLREDNLELLKSNLTRDSNDDRPFEERFQNFDWYLQLRELGSFPHGGFGIGIERLIKSLLGIKNIKDTIAFPRWPGRCSM